MPRRTADGYSGTAAVVRVALIRVFPVPCGTSPVSCSEAPRVHVQTLRALRAHLRLVSLSLCNLLCTRARGGMAVTHRFERPSCAQVGHRRLGSTQAHPAFWTRDVCPCVGRCWCICRGRRRGILPQVLLPVHSRAALPRDCLRPAQSAPAWVHPGLQPASRRVVLRAPAAERESGC